MRAMPYVKSQSEIVPIKESSLNTRAKSAGEKLDAETVSKVIICTPLGLSCNPCKYSRATDGKKF
jgi:hypothetical protein